MGRMDLSYNAIPPNVPLPPTRLRILLGVIKTYIIPISSLNSEEYSWVEWY